ncbi:MAG: hypothetical protein A2Z99_19025 [Treponema sp. GWB1_62_6]|nr:MAG: hypothetical protein A2Z99_19025 [Treponema sp. GWB1_62_6]
MNGLAVAARRRGERTEARSILDEALKRAAETGMVQAAVETRIEMAVLLIEDDEFHEAREILDAAVADSMRTGTSRKLSECFRLRSLASESLGDYAASLADFKHFHEAESDLATERIAQSAKGAEIRFELERARNEAEIFRLRNVELKDGRAELERTNDRLKAVAEIGRSITASLDMEAVARTVHESVSHLMDATGFSLAVLDPTRRILDYRLYISDGKNVPPFSLSADSPDSFAAWVVSRNESLRIDDADAEYKKYIASDRLSFGRSTASIIFVPLSLGDRVVGAVGVQSPRRAAYHDEDLRLLSALGSYIAVAIENSRTHEEVRRLNEELRNEKASLERLARRVSKIANHDGLTGLPNRLLLGELLEKSLSRAARSKKRIALMFMDLDDFKPINDRFGHLAGDQALIEVSRRLKSALRDSDVVARVGGDEFVAVVGDVEESAAVRVVAEKLIAAFSVPIEVQGENCPVGISIGIAIYPEAARTADELMRRADETMYEVKRSGKNGYMVHES